MSDAPDRESRPSAEMMELLHRHLLGASTEAEAVKLEQELLRSPQLRAEYLRATRIDAVLYDEFLRRGVPTAPSIIAFPWVRVLTAVAAVFVAAFLWRGLVAPTSPAPVANMEVATLLDTRDCRWTDGRTLQQDERLSQEVIHLQSGVALIEFDDGARMALTGPASLEIQGANRARLLKGAASVRCEDGAEGFSLVTPTSTVIDLGTEFGVKVSEDGASAVEVLDGVVEVEAVLPSPRPTTRILEAGEGIRLNADGTDRLAPAKPEGWVRDYTSKPERESRARPPRLIAMDSFSNASVQDFADYIGGSGWRGPWIGTTEPGGPPLAFAPLSPIAKRIPDSGESVLLTGNQEMRRVLAKPIDPTRRSVVYLGFSFHRIAPAQPDPAVKRGGMSVFLCASTDLTDFIGGGLNGGNRWATVDTNRIEISRSKATGSGPYYAIVRIDFRPTIGNRIAVSGHSSAAAIPTEETKNWDMITRRRIGVKKVPLDVITIRSQDPYGFKIGEIYVGTSWAAVANPSAAEKPVGNL